MPLTLRWKDQTQLPVEGSSILPEAFASLGPRDAARVEIRVGNGLVPLGDLFAIEGDPGDACLVLEGDLSHLHGLAPGMSSGTLTLRGSVGDRLAVGILGGRVEVEGSVGAWAFADMKGGTVRVSGDAGPRFAAALPGSRVGMTDGVVLVDGSVGSEAGASMRGGLIAIGGSAGEALGNAMIAGSIFVVGSVDRLPGLGMKRGSIVAFDPAFPLMPTFAASGRFRPHTLNIYLAKLARLGFPRGGGGLSTPETARYNGDLANGGQGEILLVRA